jgi:acyl-coenzyme A synthetase/AMP-(fatty) acid ligase
VIESAFCSTGKLVDCLAVGQTIAGGTDERVLLFVQLPDTQTLSPTLVRQIKDEVRSRRSPRHVPAEASYTLHYALLAAHPTRIRSFKFRRFRTP